VSRRRHERRHERRRVICFHGDHSDSHGERRPSSVDQAMAECTNIQGGQIKGKLHWIISKSLLQRAKRWFCQQFMCYLRTAPDPKGVRDGDGSSIGDVLADARKADLNWKL